MSILLSFPVDLLISSSFLSGTEFCIALVVRLTADIPETQSAQLQRSAYAWNFFDSTAEQVDITNQEISCELVDESFEAILALFDSPCIFHRCPMNRFNVRYFVGRSTGGTKETANKGVQRQVGPFNDFGVLCVPKGAQDNQPRFRCRGVLFLPLSETIRRRMTLAWNNSSQSNPQVCPLMLACSS